MLSLVRLKGLIWYRGTHIISTVQKSGVYLLEQIIDLSVVLFYLYFISKDILQASNDMLAFAIIKEGLVTKGCAKKSRDWPGLSHMRIMDLFPNVLKAAFTFEIAV